jgi:crotonobetainyl-CoA:carnitine CoA-transferase CaiB-like acyl-CoA transferase
MSTMPRPLDGVRVLDLSRLLPGPFCSLILSDLGAHVDKVEDPHAGDYLRFMPPLFPQGGVSGRYVALNRDKRSLCLDLKSPAGRAALLRLLPHYQVLLESFRPGVLDRLGLPLSVLHQHHPALVVCSISGYGQDGPYRDRAGHDLNYCALSGVLGMSGSSPQAPPHPLPIQLADLGAGGLWATVGILGALRTAERTGQGSHLDISMCEGTVGFLLPDLGNLAAQGPDAVDPGRGDDLLTGGMACYSVYQTQDDKFLAVAALEPKFWHNLNGALGRPSDPSELVAPPAEQQRLRAELQAIFRQKTRAQWEVVFAHTDACVEPVLLPSELASHPLHVARQVFFQTTPSAEAPPESALPQVRTPLTPRGAVAAAPPTQGQHSVQILRESGFSDAEIAELQQAGVTR